MADESKGGIACIVVGGCANGLLLRSIRPDAEMIELSRPNYIKPLASSFQSRPEIANEKDVYEVHPLSLKDTAVHRPTLTAIAVVKGKSLSWAYTQIISGFVNDYTRQLMDEGIITKQ